MADREARMHVIAILPQLKILDFDLITEQDLLEAFENFPLKNAINFNFDETDFDNEDKRSALRNAKPPDKDAYVDGLINGKGFKSLIDSDKNFELLIFFPPVSGIAENYQTQIDAVFQEWHKIGHMYYQKISEEKDEFISSVKDISSVALNTAREEERKFTDFKGQLPKKLCLMYQKCNSIMEDDDLSNLKESCLVEHQNTLNNLMNSICMKVGLLFNISKIFEEAMQKIFEDYIGEVNECCKRITMIDQNCASELKKFYCNLIETGFEMDGMKNEDGDIIILKPPLKQLLQKKEFIEATSELSIKMHSALLDGKVKNLKAKLHRDMNKILDEAIENEALRSQDEQVRNIVVYCNKQKLYIEKLFSKSSSFKHHLGYR